MNYQSKTYRLARNIGRALGITRLIGRVIANKGYEQKFDDALDKAITNDSVVWDIGANHGIYTDKFFKILGTKGKLLAFEPNQELHKNLIDKYKDISNVEILGIAVSNFTGETSFSKGDDDLAATSTIGDATDNSYKVAVEDINDLVGRLTAPDVVKVDAEGAEAEILNRVASNLTFFENIKFFVEVHFGIIENNHDSDLFFKDLRVLKSNSREFVWIDPSHLYFKL